MSEGMNPKNKGYNLLHIEWKCEETTRDGKEGLLTSIKDSTIKCKTRDLVHMLVSLGDDKDIKRAIIYAADELKEKGEMSADRLSKSASKLASMLEDLIRTSKSGK